MSKYQPLWEHLAQLQATAAQLSYAEIEDVLGFALDHSFLKFKKELLAYGWQVEKISMKQQWVRFKRVPVPLETERLVLRPFTKGDAEDVFAACSNPILGERAGWPPHETLDDSLAYINNIAPLGLVWAVTENRKGAPVVGSIGLLSDPRMPEDDCVMMLGYWLHQDFWNRGYTTEAAQTLLDWARAHCGLRLITTSHFLDNDSSRRVIEKCGFTALGEGAFEDDPSSVMWYELAVQK